MKGMRVINRLLLNLFAVIFVVIFIGEALSDEASLDLSSIELIAILIFSIGLGVGSFVIWVKEVLGAVIIVGTLIVLNVLFMVVEGQFSLQVDFILIIALGLLQIFFVWLDTSEFVK